MTAKRLFITTCGVALCMFLYSQNIDHVAMEDTLEDVSVKGVLRGRDFASASPKYTLSTEHTAQFGITDLSDALHRLPGVTLRDYGGAGGLKTVSVRGFGAQHTAVVYDGVALSDCQTGQIDVSRYTLNDVATLSLVVGDNDDIFLPAKNAASAASLYINNRCKLPSSDLDTHITAQLTTGSWSYANPFVRVEKNVSEKLGFSIAGDYIYTENDYPYTIINGTQKMKDRRNHNRVRSGHGEMNVVYRPTHHDVLSLKAYYYDNSRQLPGMVHYYVNANREHLRDQNAFAQMNWKGELAENWQMAVTAKFDYTMTAYQDPSYANNIKDHQYWQREAYATASILYTAMPWSISYAADYTYNNLSGSDVSTYRDPLRHTALQSLAAKYSAGRFTAMGRLLYSLYFNDARRGSAAKDVKHLSPSVSLNWKILANEMLYARVSYKDIFRSPSFNELYYAHYGSTDLKPERTNQWNAGVTWRHDYGQKSNFVLTVDGYYNHVKDKIIAVPYNMFIWTNINMGRVKTVGVDATASVTQRLGDQHTLLFNANYTWQQVQNATNGDSHKGNQIAYTPKHSGGFSIAWENPWLNVSANGLFATSRWANNEHYIGTLLKGYSDFGMTVYRDIRYKKNIFSLRFDVKNIFNQQYEIVRFYPMPGRSWQMTLKYHI